MSEKQTPMLCLDKPDVFLNSKVAMRFGIPAALIIARLDFLITRNRDRNWVRFHYENIWWSDETRDEMFDRFPFISHTVFKLAFKNLKQLGVIFCHKEGRKYRYSIEYGVLSGELKGSKSDPFDSGSIGSKSDPLIGSKLDPFRSLKGSKSDPIRVQIGPLLPNADVETQGFPAPKALKAINTKAQKGSKNDSCTLSLVKNLVSDDLYNLASQWLGWIKANDAQTKLTEIDLLGSLQEIQKILGCNFESLDMFLSLVIAHPFYSSKFLSPSCWKEMIGDKKMISVAMAEMKTRRRKKF